MCQLWSCVSIGTQVSAALPILSYLHCPALHCTVLHCTLLHCTTLYCTALYCPVLHWTLLHCTARNCTALNCMYWYCTLCTGTALHCPGDGDCIRLTYLLPGEHAMCSTSFSGLVKYTAKTNCFWRLRRP